MSTFNGTNIADSMIDQNLPNTNHGTEDWVMASMTFPAIPPANYVKRTVIAFDISGFPGSTADITAAMLRLCYWHYGGPWPGYDPVGENVWAYKCTKPFTEAGVTWNKYDGVNNWDTPGGDWVAIAPAGASLPVPGPYPWPPPPINVYMEWPVEEIVIDAIDHVAGIARFLVKFESEANALLMDWWAKENLVNVPELVITYSVPPHRFYSLCTKRMFRS